MRFGDFLRTSVLLFGAAATACAVVAIVSAAGPAVQRIVPWVGAVQLRSDVVPFREPPEPQVSVQLDEAGKQRAGKPDGLPGTGKTPGGLHRRDLVIRYRDCVAL